MGKTLNDSAWTEINPHVYIAYGTETVNYREAISQWVLQNAREIGEFYNNIYDEND